MKYKVFCVLLAGTVLVLSFLSYSHRHSQENDVSRYKLIATHIYDSLNAAFEDPIAISKAMACDTFLKDALRKERTSSEKEAEDVVSSYLAALKENFGYNAAFVVSEGTRRYYTPEGISKIVNPKETPYDIWYQLFIDSGKEFDLDTDLDQVNGYRWTVFVNARITDDDGSLLGVCGLGLFMDDLQDMVLASENEYRVKINLIDAEGLVRVDSDSMNIENAYISDAIADNAGDGAFTYAKRGIGGFRMTRYMQNLEWFLVVQGFGMRSGSGFLGLFSIVQYVLLLVLIVLIVAGREKSSRFCTAGEEETEDPLTGIPNRNYVKEAYGELGVFNTVRYKSLVMFDIDNFKSVNDTRNGDAIVVGVVGLAKKAVDENGILFRWAGDEFVCFMELSADECEPVFRQLCQDVKTKYEVSISVGLVDVDLTQTIKTNYHRAVQQCYVVKENGGNGVRRK